MKVIKFKDGSLTRKKEGSKYTSVLVTSETLSLVNGTIQTNKRTSAIAIPDEVVALMNVTEGMDMNAKLKSLGLGECRIQRIQTALPQYEGHVQAVNPETSEVMPYYLQFRVASIADADINDTVVETVAIAEKGELA